MWKELRGRRHRLIAGWAGMAGETAHAARHQPGRRVAPWGVPLRLGGSVLAVLLTATWWGCSADNDQPRLPPPDVLIPTSGGRYIGPRGGEVRVGPVILSFPPGAVTDSVWIEVSTVQQEQPASPGGLPLPLEPPAISAVSVQPGGLKLLRPVGLGIATTMNVSQLAVAAATEQPDKQLAWTPLAGQGRSPGLLSAQISHLGVFALAQVDCCGSSSAMGCSAQCDVGPLHYSCASATGPAGAQPCCDPFASAGQQSPVELCAVVAPDMGM